MTIRNLTKPGTASCLFFISLICFLIITAASVHLSRATSKTTTPNKEESATRPTGPFDDKLSQDDSLWVEETLGNMSVDEKIGQMFIVPFTGAFVNRSSPYFQELRRLIEERHVGGFRMYRGQSVEAALLINHLQRLAKIPLVIASNFERGSDQLNREYAVVRRFGDAYTHARAGITFPSNMAMGATNSETFAFFQGAVSAIEARAIGVHWIFAPVVDVNNNPDNPIINVRSFGEDPERVAALGRAFVRGAQANGVIATAKHFPGHGDTELDSHTDLPTVNVDWQRFNAVELAPFKAAVQTGVGAVMTSHIRFPQIEPNPDLPATLSSTLLQHVLRDTLGFNGLVITDAMTMHAISKRWETGEAAVAAVRAGADCILTPPSNEIAIQALVQAVQNGQLSEARIDSSVRRILTAKAHLGLHHNRFTAMDRLDSLLAQPRLLETAQQVADAAVTLVKDARNILPLNDELAAGKICAVTVTDKKTAGLDDVYRDALKKRAAHLEIAGVTRADSPAKNQQVLGKAKAADVVLCFIFAKVVAYKGTVGLPDQVSQFVHELLKTGKPTVLLSLGNPYLIRTFPEAPTYLTTYGSSYSAQVAAVKALFGEIDMKGKLPISIPGMYKIGDGIEVARTQPASKPVVVFQPSHQTDTGQDFNEALTCNAIVEAAMKASSGQLDVNKVWSFDVPGLHHAREGSNTRIAQTSAVVDGQISGYAFELAESNKLSPDVFVAVHNNGGTKRHACWGFVHEGDPYEWMNRELAQALVDAICQATGLENRGVLGDSAPGRNDYRCVSTGKRAFYSLDEHVNQAPLRVLLEIGDNRESREFLADPTNLTTIGQTIQRVLETRFGRN